MNRYAAAVAVFVLTLLAGPPQARAAGEVFVSSFDYICTTTAGVRHGWWAADSHVDAPGTLVSLQLSTPSALREHTAPGTAVNANTRFSATFTVGRGPTEMTFTATVRWEQRPDGGPLEVTVRQTQRLNDCEEHPTATLASKCDGTVEVRYGNGGPGDLKNTGGEVAFEFFGAFGYHVGPYWPNSWRGLNTHVVPAAAASSIRVTGNGKTLVQGGYQAAPGCVGYVAPDNPRPQQPGGQTGAGQPAAAPPPTAAPGHSADPQASDSATTSAAAPPAATEPSAAEAAPSSGFPGYLVAGLVLVGLLVGLVPVVWAMRRAKPENQE